MEKEKCIRDAEIAITFEMLAMPCFLMIYKSEALFWVFLILMDSFILKRYDVVGLIKCMMNPEKKQDMKTFKILIIGGGICLVILAFRSLYLAGALLLNSIVMDVVSFISHMKSQEK